MLNASANNANIICSIESICQTIVMCRLIGDYTVDEIG